jgi:hypothetical protein
MPPDGSPLVRPNVVGFVDVGVGSEGIAAFYHRGCPC